MQWKVDFIQQTATISSVAGLRSSSKTLPKAKLAPKKGHGHCLVACCPSDSLQLSESWWNHSIWEACSANRWDAPKTASLQPALVNIKGPVLRDNAWPQVWQTVLQKFNELGYKVLPHPPYSPDLSPTTYHLKHLENLHNQEAENAFQEFTESWSMDFYATEINKPISSWKICAECNGSYFD